ncbi:MAG: hypothetical protein HYZ51_04870 [Candidatus Doudnabacteria bacterium]|nr:hypothetical protein [Candidatus Doudnabacteria bacterium]
MQKVLSFTRRFLELILPVLLMAWCTVLLAQKIDLPVADIGRHIKNGEIIVNSPRQDKWAVLKTNFYSYTEPNREFVNHHWLSGLVFYFVHHTFGFEGLSVFYILLVISAFFLFFRLAQKQAGSPIAAVLAVFILPIIASRTEVRPEGFTYFFMAVFYWLLWRWRMGMINPKRLFLLPIIIMFWVNLHIGFIFGFLILFVFWFRALIKFWQTKKAGNLYFLSFIGFLCLLAGLINPFFIKGLFYPLNIFREYGYLVVENQSVMFLERLAQGSKLYFSLFKFLLVLSFLSFFVRSFRQSGRAQFPYQDFLLLASAGVLSLFAIRNFPVFGLLFLPIVSANIKSILPEFKHPAYKLMPVIVAAVVLIAGSFRFWERYQFSRETFGIGLKPQVNNAAEFFLSNHIRGPVFNNYDIGGYLVYYLYPAERVFTDNRPEA